ncbi:hypothetical protein D9619_002565 [Psilocybe cf. subviscida]|uniref:Aminotransferase class V domain-containing protein n=1 Tax=Psilocybe cf. subviscida TaxID=2480587 RepID=A0A8H5AX27_9AGAR|nr:hypothetical protein D9619_002565 [Psilocybe cf. subviscida]
MGSAASCHRPPPSASKEPRKRLFSRKRSTAVFSPGGAETSRSNTLSSSHELSKEVPNEKPSGHHFQDEKSGSRHSAPIHSSDYHPEDAEEREAFDKFIREYPEYQQTSIIDTLRRTDFTRLARGNETYVDYMGGAVYPESLVKTHSDFLSRNILGNTHSVSNSSKLSLQCADEARDAVLKHFGASSDYTVVFTSNASGALKLVGESFPFVAGSKLVIGVDSHNSVHGIREFASYKDGQTVYIPTTSQGGFDIPTAKDILLQNRPNSDSNSQSAPSLFVLTAQSNITNSKTPLSMAEYAASIGYHTVVDGAALAATSLINISEYPIDAMAVSFYKMFGYPTGVGALIVKKSFLAQLKRPWFSGGNVDIVQIPGSIFTRVKASHEQFEDGTINYTQLPTITYGLNFISAYLPFLPLRLSLLLSYLTTSLSELRHVTTGQPVLRVLSRLPGQRLKSVGEQSDVGSVVSMIFFGPDGRILPNTFVEYAASTQNISLRTGCMCNPGGAAALLGLTTEMQNMYPGITSAEMEVQLGRQLGVVRVSLGLASSFEDVRKVIKFAASIGDEPDRMLLWKRWEEYQSSEAH